ncbi:MAG: DUF3137 domain-containing protein [Candidatus Electrothrix sp. AR4]|nr:DUF3137 domain-containing protein [Candidatus Electrothrix sp. AR4]
MKTLQELQDLYQEALLPDLEVLEKKRKKAYKKIHLLGGGVLLLAAAIIGLLFNTVSDKGSLFMITGSVGTVIITIGYHFFTKDYVREFKAKIIQKIVSFIDSNLTYSSTGCVSRSQFTDSGIFNRQPDKYKGDDLVRGKIGATQMEFSEIHAQYKTETKDSKGNRRTQWHTIFKGMFFLADFNKHFKGRTVVLPDNAERIMGGLAKMFQSWNISRDQLVKLEDPEFEKFFVVYSDDQVEARYILSTSLMKRISDFKKKSNRKIYISFAGSKIYVAVSYSKSLFEPRVFKTILDFKPIQEYFEDLILVVGLVEDLNLNTRIWTKH